MIDWHSHVLPCMDDGSRSVSESLSMLKAQAAQGVSVTVATPHFYANDETVEVFLERRQESAERLRAEMEDDMPKLLLGAEVRYYQGISRMNELKKLRAEGSRVLLIEMPFMRWTEYMLRDISELSCRSGVQVVLAHIERYLKFQKRDTFDLIAGEGILFQSNASFFEAITTRRKAVSMLKKGKIHFLGSDCHNMTVRPVNIGRAFDIVENKLGKDFLQQMNEYGHSVLGTI